MVFLANPLNYRPHDFALHVPTRVRLLDVMRQVGDPNLINLAAGLPSVHCVPKAHLREAFCPLFDVVESFRRHRTK